MNVSESIDIEVDMTTFLEVGRVFKRAYRDLADNVVLTLASGELMVEFCNGGAVMECEHVRDLVAELTGRQFARIISVYKNDKDTTGMIGISFRQELGELGTPLAGAKAKIRLLN